MIKWIAARGARSGGVGRTESRVLTSSMAEGAAAAEEDDASARAFNQTEKSSSPSLCISMAVAEVVVSSSRGRFGVGRKRCGGGRWGDLCGDLSDCI